MKVTLRFEDAEHTVTNKTFSQDFISGHIFRKTLEMQKLLGKGIDEHTLDTFVDYAVLLFNKQFTADEFYSGIDARKIIDEIVRLIDEIVNDAGEAVGADDSDPNSP